MNCVHLALDHCLCRVPNAAGYQPIIVSNTLFIGHDDASHANIIKVREGSYDTSRILDMYDKPNEDIAPLNRGAWVGCCAADTEA